MRACVRNQTNKQREERIAVNEKKRMRVLLFSANTYKGEGEREERRERERERESNSGKVILFGMSCTFAKFVPALKCPILKHKVPHYIYVYILNIYG